jgi:hypothetical protein
VNQALNKTGEIKMKIMKIKQFIGLAIMLCIVAIAHVSVTMAWSAESDDREPGLPAGCEQIAVPAGNRVALKVYALGVQIYRWNGTVWAFVGPEANLYADAKYRGKIGTHYAGPTWESNSGSLVIGETPVSCNPDPTAVAWLRLNARSGDGPGIFEGVTYIQRVNTMGGVRPTEPGTMVDQEVGIPYTTEYYFYRAGN